MAKRTSDARWKAIRKKVLEEEPVCHWCRRAASTEADHLVPWDAGGTDDRDNLVGSCKECNSRRGARYRNKKHGGNPGARYKIDVAQGTRVGTIVDGVWQSECGWCGITFNPGRPNGKNNGTNGIVGRYCSQACAHDGQRQTWFEPDQYLHQWTCCVCGTWSETTTMNPNHKRRTCSATCAERLNGRQSVERYERDDGADHNSKYPKPLDVERKVTVIPGKPIAPKSGVERFARKAEPTVFRADMPSTPAPIAPYLSLTEMDSGGSSLDAMGVWQSGPIPPRLVTPTLGGEDWADQIAQFAHDHLGTDLWPWQLDILRGVTEHQDDAFTHRWGLFSTARQNGKTKLIAALIGWWITSGRIARGGPQQVLSVAHKLDTAEQIAYELFPVLETVFGFDCWQSSGRMIARHDDGSIWRIQSATPKAGHGTTNDLLVVDELFDVHEVVLNSGLLPTQRSRPNPLAVFCSTAGTEASTAFRRWRERGIKIVETGVPDRLFFAEWSPPPNVDPSDRRYWHMANPALGCGFLTMQDIEDEWRSPDRDAFIRSSLNMWTAAHQGWIPHGIWETLLTEEPMPDGGFLAVDSDLSENGYSAVRAVNRPDGLIQVRHEFTVDRLAELWPAIEAVSSSTKPVLALTPGLAQIAPPLMGEKAVTVGRIEMQRFTQLVRNTILERQLAHGGQVMFSEHVNRAVTATANGALTLSSSRSPGPIELARCMVWAVGLALKPVRTGKPEFGRARS